MGNLMKNFAFVFLGALLLSGCATYRFQHGSPPYDKGYVVSRDDRAILEYTLGKDNTVPGIKLAKERFNKRKKVVEDYYKRMGFVQNHFTMTFWEPTISFYKLVGGVFRLPFIVVSDYRYEHNPKYREKIRKLEEERDLREETKIKKLKEKLNNYVQSELAKEFPIEEQKSEEEVVQAVKEKLATETKPVEQVVQEIIEAKPAEKLSQEQLPEKEPVLAEKKPETVEVKQEEKKAQEIEQQPLAKEEQVEEKSFSRAEGLKAVIIAKPVKGNSPLMVKFNGLRSTSKYGKVVSYHWDFGDTESSIKPNAVNTYWSTTYGARYFTAVLTIKDDKGNLASSSIVIEVLTK